MFRFLLWSFLLGLPLLGIGQRRTYLGLNLAPLVMGTADLRLETMLHPKVSLQLAGGARWQGRVNGDTNSLGFLGDYTAQRNRAVFLGVGARFVHQDPLDYEYPFMAIDLTGMYLHDDYLARDPQGQLTAMETKGFHWGASFSMGFVLRLAENLRLDLAGQMAYSPARPEFLAYYLPNVGYTTFGYSYIGAKSFHLQPIVTLKYNIIKGQRQRIREVD